MQNKKVFLVHVIIHDGEHEHRDETLIKAKSAATAANIARRLVASYGGTEAGYFDYGDGETMTTLKHVEEISQEEAAVLTKYNVCNYAN